MRIGFTQQEYKLEFAGMFGQWRSVSIRYTALPPALVRGVVRVAHTGTGGSTNSRQQNVKNDLAVFTVLFFTLFCERYAGDGLPPPPV